MTIKILILEDNPIDRKSIIGRLGVQYDVEAFYNPDDFKKAVSKETNMVIMDIKMPEFPSYDIFETLNWLRLKYSGIYKIVISGYFNNEIYKNLIRCGVDDTVEKGVDLSYLDELQQCIARLIPFIELKHEATHA